VKANSTCYSLVTYAYVHLLIFTPTPAEALERAQVEETSPGNTPTLHELLNFPGQERRINIPQEISTQYKKFGTILLEDVSCARVDNVMHECGERAETYLHKNPTGLAKWKREAASDMGNPC